MGKSDPDSTAGGRKRQLNVIYFVDSARTRSFKISLGRLNVLLLLLGGMLTWSVASVGLFIWMGRGQEDLALQLRKALAAVLDYEVRYDGVYELAYPSGDQDAQPSDPLASVQGSAPPGASEDADVPPTQPEVAASPATPSGPANSGESVRVDASVVQGSSDNAPAGDKTPASADQAPATSPGEANVAVSNPVVEASSKALELRFDLTSKRGQDRAEGFVWAVAEFNGDDGKKYFVGAPTAIQVKDDGEPAFPQRSAIFGIRRFKKKVFSFPLIKNVAGTFTVVRIGLMDRGGNNRTTYNVPVNIKIGSEDAGGGSNEPTGGSKSE